MTSSVQRRWLFTIVGLTLAVVIGVVLFRRPAAAPGAPPRAALPPPKAPVASVPPEPDRSGRAVKSAPVPAAEPPDARSVYVAALQIRDPAERSRAADLALRRWLREDFAAAFAHVQALPAGEPHTQAVVEVARAFAARNPEESITWSNSLADPHERRLARLTTVEFWADDDPGAAGKYVAQLDPGPMQMSAAAHVARSMASDSPEAAVTWAQSLPNVSARDFALISIASTWAQRDPAAAAKWASELPAGETRGQALNGALSYWLIQDPAATKKFVAGLAGEMQTRAAAFIAPMLVQTNAPDATEWARTLPHPEARDAALAVVFGRWRDRKPAEAEAWLKSAKLPAATRSKLQKGR